MDNKNIRVHIIKPKGVEVEVKVTVKVATTDGKRTGNLVTVE